MELSRSTDYSLRLLIFAGMHRDRVVTVPEVASAFAISENHLVKVAHQLGKDGFLETRRGRSGGVRLAKDPSKIRLGDVIRETESLALFECLGEDGGSCPINRACLLKKITAEARDAFLDTFDRYTLEDLLVSKKAMLKALG